MRKLASIAKINKLEPIPNADQILKATIKGWECVVSKSEGFQEGDKVIFIEVDSVLPPRPEFSFMANRDYRVKIIRLRKQISQGLVLPMDYLKEDFPEGTDVTHLLGITKFDPQADEEALMFKSTFGYSFSRFLKPLLRFKWFRKLYSKLSVKNCKVPTNIVPKTSETKIQDLPKIINNLPAYTSSFYATEKLDGSSATYFIYNNQFGVCSRNLWLKREDNSYYWEVARRFQIEETLKDIKKQFESHKVVIQGEIIGNNIQGNKYKISGYDFYIFNVFIDNIQLPQDSLETLCRNYNLNTVPVVYDTVILPNTVKEIVELSKGKSKLLDSQQREGLILRDYTHGLSFKVLNPDFS